MNDYRYYSGPYRMSDYSYHNSNDSDASENITLSSSSVSPLFPSMFAGLGFHTVTGAWRGEELNFDLWPPARPGESAKLHYSHDDRAIFSLGVHEEVTVHPNHSTQMPRLYLCSQLKALARSNMTITAGL